MVHHHPRRRERERGFVLYVYTLMMIFIIIPMVGLAIDAGIMYFIKSKLQTAVDGAALGAARSLNRAQDIPSQQVAATDTAVRYYHANFPNTWMGVTPVNDPTVTWPVAPPATAIINVQGDVDAPTWFMRIIGVNSLHFTAVSQATRRNVNVMLVIDRSGSLGTGGSNSCPQVASSATQFVQSFSNNRDRMGMITFGTYYNLDYAPSFDFQTGMSTKLSSLTCWGWTNAGAAFWNGYQALKGLGDLNALNVILFFTDGQPNTITFGQYAGGTSPLLPVKASSTCAATPGFSGVIGGGGDGIYQQTLNIYPAPQNDSITIDGSYGYNGGCAFPSRPYQASSDVAYLPDTDAFGNSISTSLLGGSGFPAPVNTSGGQIQVNSSNVTNGGINALDNAAQRAKEDAAASNMPFICYTIGLGNSGGVNDELLKRIANDPGALAHQTVYPDGIYIYTPDTAHLNSAFSTIASDILRLSK